MPFSLKFSEKNKNALEKIAKTKNMKYGPLVNEIIETFCSMSPKIKNSFLDYCVNRCIQLEKELQYAGEFERPALLEEIKEYKKIANLINAGEDIYYPYEEEVEESTTKEVEIKNGTLVIPKEWILLNEKDAKESTYVGVVECINSASYGIPHFVFFTNNPVDETIPDEEIKEINNMCVNAWEKFQEVVLNNQIKAIPDPEHKGRYLNRKEYLEAPLLGYFPIRRIDEFEGDVKDLPAGAMIK